MLLTIFTKRSILDVWQGAEYTSGWQTETCQIKQICVLVKNKCFYSFTNDSKLKLN